MIKVLGKLGPHKVTPLLPIVGLLLDRLALRSLSMDGHWLHPGIQTWLRDL